MKFLKFSVGACFALALAFSSCSKDDSGSEPVNPDDGGSGEMSVLTPQESKTFLSNTAKNLMSKFDPSQQREFMKFAADFGEQYGDLEAPENFYIDEEDSPAYMMRALAKGVQEGSPAAITRTVYEYVYNINFKQFSGEYVPGHYSWVKKRDSKDIVFSFEDRAGNPCEIKVTASSDTSDGTITITDEDWYWDEYYKDIYNFSIPCTMTLTVNQNGKTLAGATVKSKINLNGHSLDADVKVYVQNIEVQATVNGTDRKVTQTAKLLVSGETLITEKAEVTGNNLCNIDAIQNALDQEGDDSDVLLSFFDGGVANLDVMGDVQVYGQVTFNREIIRAVKNSECEWGYYSDLSKSEAKEKVAAAAAAFNKYVSAVLKYQNKSTTQATLFFETAQHSYSNWGYFEVEPQLMFEDETTYSFEEYFSYGFSSVTTAWDDLISSYEHVWRSVSRNR